MLSHCHSIFLILATQLTQSAHFALQLPYTVFGLGRTPNFVDQMFVGIPQAEEKVSYREIVERIPVQAAAFRQLP